MIQSEIQEVNYFVPENPSSFPACYGLLQNNFPELQFSRFMNYQASLPGIHDLGLNSSCISSNSTSDEADDNPAGIIDERKQRRMISNRESARRSRMRKQRHLDELWSQVLRLRNENHSLLSKLNDVSESHDRVVVENARLKEEASDLRQMLMDLQIGNSYAILRDLDDTPCNKSHLRDESPAQSVTTTSANLLI
ncbi:basic leucine zipper 43-like [Andrographis paniculata]|uniref:basic leucine zipper 43-like n=1 Tax=Andrographis paniculata TaxID=175694 RepID=UPI0021E84AC5|nr:basic leucine zipper 43-like [Andrographis paniculata]